MSLITDPWDDDDVQVEELDSRFKKIRTVQHRTVSKRITSLDLTFTLSLSFISSIPHGMIRPLQIVRRWPKSKSSQLSES